jgi:hypothetical protein
MLKYQEAYVEAAEMILYPRRLEEINSDGLLTSLGENL